MQSKWNRRSTTPEKPVFTLSHRVGFKGILGSEYNYHHTELGFYKRFWFSAFGYTDCIIKAGKVWNKVPFPMLIIPNANLSYTIQRESYSLMNAMEFFNDEYASWDLTYNMNGLLLNRIPLIRKLKWREVILLGIVSANITAAKTYPNVMLLVDYDFCHGVTLEDAWMALGVILREGLCG